MVSPWIAMVFPGAGWSRCAGAVTEVDDSLGMDGALCQASATQLVGGGCGGGHGLGHGCHGFWGYHGGHAPPKGLEHMNTLL